mgnify:CR=1 FL=1
MILALLQLNTDALQTNSYTGGFFGLDSSELGWFSCAFCDKIGVWFFGLDEEVVFDWGLGGRVELVRVVLSFFEVVEVGARVDGTIHFQKL